MFRSTLLRGASACALTFAFAPDMARAQEALPTIDIGASRATQSEKPESPGAADKFGNLPQETYVTPNASTATKMDVPLRDTPQPVKVITPKLLQDQGPELRVYDLANNVSGVFGDPQGSGGGVQNTPMFQIRGFGNGGRILLDGIERDYSGTGMDLADVDHVEFAKGPSSTLYGAVGLGYGGIVNFATKKPTDKFFATVSEGIGSFAFHRTTIDINTPLREDKSILFRLNAAFEERGSVRHFEYHDGIFVAPALTLIFDNGDKLGFHGQYGVNHDRAAPGVPLFPIFQSLPRERYFWDIRANQNNTLANATLKYEHKFDENWNVTAVADYSRYGSMYPGSFGGFDGVSTYILGPAGTLGGGKSDTLYGEIDLNGKIDTFGIKHNLVFGLYRKNNWSSSHAVISPAVLAPTQIESINIFYPIYPSDACFYPLPSCGPAIPGAIKNWTWLNAVYGQDLIEITDQFKLLLGGRYDYGKQWTFTDDPTGLQGGSSWAPARKFDNFSPHAGAVFQPFEETSIFAGWGRSFNPTNGDLRPGQPAPPEFAEQIDVGIKQEFLGGKVRVGATAFDITRKNVLVPDPADPSGRNNILIGQYHSHGLEFDLGGEILPNLRMDASATFMHGVVAKDASRPTWEGSELTYAPRRFYNVSGVYRFKEGELKGLEIGAKFYYASKMPALFPNNPQASYTALQNGGLNAFNQYPFTVAPIYNFGLFSSYEIDKNLRVQINADNLFDRSNWKSSGGSMLRGTPRSIFANITYKFE